tara:strand:+ start:498 stop:1022 length:525 start_codon:yes stop_codon:yes gene_type:complete
MDFNKYDYVEPKGVNGKILITSFPGLDENGIFQEVNFQSQLNILQKNNCSSITSFIINEEFDKLCNKKQFIENIYKHNIKWYHLPIIDLSAPDSEFKYQWQIKKVLLKKELIAGNNILLHCWGGKGRAGTIAAILLIEFSENNNEAINIVRAKRKGAIESKAQEDFILSYRPIN